MKTNFKSGSKTLIAAASLAFSLLSQGCGKLDFTQTLLRPLVPIQMSSAQGVEVVSGSSVGQHTLLNNYTVDASVGAIQDKLESRTPGGYTVYHGVKGAIVSDQH